MPIYNPFYPFLFAATVFAQVLPAQSEFLGMKKGVHLIMENETDKIQPTTEWGFWDKIYTLEGKNTPKTVLILNYKGEVLQTKTWHNQPAKKWVEVRENLLRGEQNYEQKNTYNANNQLTVADFYYENGQFWKKETYEYNSKNLVVKKTILNPENQPTEVWSYEYDSLNNPIALIYQQPKNGKREQKTFWEYKDDRLLTAIFEYDNGEMSRKQTFDYGLDSISTIWTYDSRLNPQHKDSLVYNEKGQLVGKFYWQKNPIDQQLNLLFKKEKMAYNAQNQLIELVTYGETGDEISVQHWDYNDKNQLLAVRLLDTMGNELKRKTLVYNDKNQLVGEKQTVAQYISGYESEELNPNGKIVKKLLWQPQIQSRNEVDYYYNDKQQLISTETYLYPNNQPLEACQKGENKQLVVSTQLSYDEKNNIKEEVSEYLNLETKILEKSRNLYLYPTPKSKTPFIYTLNAKGDTLSRVQKFLDKKGNLQKFENQSYTENKQGSFKRVLYHKNGQELRTEVQKGDKITIRRQFEYDKNENCTSQIFRTPSNEIEKTLKITYRYDKKGNWEKKEMEENGQLAKILTRKIIYHK